MEYKLWSGMRIPIVMVSGPVNSGKTLFGLTIDPNCRKAATEVQPTTLVYDQEGSAEPYVGGLNFEWKDTRAAVAAGLHQAKLPADPLDARWLKILKESADCNDSPAAAMFRAWYLSLLQIPAGKYDVGVCDTFTPLQDGMVDWLRRHPEAFGRTVNEYTKASSMFLWPDAKAMLSHILTVDCRLRFQTFVLNVHLKNEWAGGAKTGKQVAEGLDVLEKLATLHLEFDRAPKEKGKEAPRVPAAIVKKERLVRFSPDGNDLPILPPRIPECTPDTIRRYIASPPDYGKLAAGERLPDQSMNDDEKLRLQAAIAENNRAAEESKLSALELARRAMEQGRMATPAVQVSERTPMPAQEPPQANAQPETIQVITPAQIQEMMNYLKQLFATGEEAGKWLLANFNQSNPAYLSNDQALDALSRLAKGLAEKKMAETAATAPVPEQQDTAGPATQEQRATIRDLTIRLFGEKAGPTQDEWLRSLGIGSAMGLKYFQAQQRIIQLEEFDRTGIPF